jgi:RimJ/RimL family protein N-acetyltransferase
MDLRSTTLVSKRLSLRAFTAEDAAEVFEAVTPTLTRYMSFEPAASLEAFAIIWQQWLTQMAAGTAIFLVVRANPSGELLGVAGLHGIGADEPKTGIWIRETAHGYGYGREATATIIAWTSISFGARCFLWPVAEKNDPSRHLAETLGGKIVGRGRLLKPLGVEYPEVIYRIPAPQP